MTEYDLSPKQPILYFIGSKDRAVCVMMKEVLGDNGLLYNECYMSLPKRLKIRYNIINDDIEKQYKEKKMDVIYDIDGNPCYIQRYKKILFDSDGQNPVDPVITVNCKFDGTEGSGQNQNILLIEKLEIEVKELREENRALDDRYMELLDKLRVLDLKYGKGNNGI